MCGPNGLCLTRQELLPARSWPPFLVVSFIFFFEIINFAIGHCMARFVWLQCPRIRKSRVLRIPSRTLANRYCCTHMHTDVLCGLSTTLSINTNSSAHSRIQSCSLVAGVVTTRAALVVKAHLQMLSFLAPRRPEWYRFIALKLDGIFLTNPSCFME